jgi:hypothetical protein
MEPTSTTEVSAEPDPSGGRGRARSLQQPLIAAIIALIVGLAAGFLIGWKVEQNRVKSDVDDLKARLREASAAPNEEPPEEQPAEVTASRPQGAVTAVSADSVTVDDASGEKVIKLSSSTQVETASPGTAADVTQGAKILLKSQRTTGPNFNAQEIVVLPPVTEFSGHTVTSVAPGSITTETAAGTANVAISDTTVIYKTAVGTLADITQGSIVIVRAEEGTDGTLSALEVVVLPAGSTFVT